jgi:predicted RNA binding protein YcfA (HicA-like mRNA interferase family)
VDSRTIVQELKRDGWYAVSHAGSHKQFKHPRKKRRVTVPHPKRNIPLGTLALSRNSTGFHTPH